LDCGNEIVENRKVLFCSHNFEFEQLKKLKNNSTTTTAATTSIIIMKLLPSTFFTSVAFAQSRNLQTSGTTDLETKWAIDENLTSEYTASSNKFVMTYMQPLQAPSTSMITCR